MSPKKKQHALAKIDQNIALLLSVRKYARGQKQEP